MLLSEALTKLKNLKSQVARIENYIEKSLMHYEDEKPEYEYKIVGSNGLGIIILDGDAVPWGGSLSFLSLSRYEETRFRGEIVHLHRVGAQFLGEGRFELVLGVQAVIVNQEKNRFIPFLKIEYLLEHLLLQQLQSVGLREPAGLILLSLGILHVGIVDNCQTRARAEPP